MLRHFAFALFALSAACTPKPKATGVVVATLPGPIVEIRQTRDTLVFSTASGDKFDIFALPVLNGELRKLATLPRGHLDTYGAANALYVTLNGDVYVVTQDAEPKLVASNVIATADAIVATDSAALVVGRTSPGAPRSWLRVQADTGQVNDVIVTPDIAIMDSGDLIVAREELTAYIGSSSGGTVEASPFSIWKQEGPEPVVRCVAATSVRLWWIRESEKKLSLWTAGRHEMPEALKVDIASFAEPIQCAGSSRWFVYTQSATIVARDDLGQRKLVANTTGSTRGLFANDDFVFWSEEQRDHQWALRRASFAKSP